MFNEKLLNLADYISVAVNRSPS